MKRRHLLMGLFALTTGCVGRSQMGTTPVPQVERDEDLPRDEEVTREATRYRVPTHGSELDTGGAMVLIDAPIERVRQVIEGYRRYSDIMPRIDESRVVGRRDGNTDVYLRALVLDGAIALWAVVRFSKPRAWQGDGRKITSRLVKGNLKEWRGAWKLTPLGHDKTILRLEMLVDVKLPVPDEWITPELMWAADKSVTAVQEIAEAGGATP